MPAPGAGSAAGGEPTAGAWTGKLEFGPGVGSCPVTACGTSLPGTPAGGNVAGDPGTGRFSAPVGAGIRTGTSSGCTTLGDAGAGGAGSGNGVFSGGGGTPSAGLGVPTTTQLPAGS